MHNLGLSDLTNFRLFIPKYRFFFNPMFFRFEKPFTILSKWNKLRYQEINILNLFNNLYIMTYSAFILTSGLISIN